VKPNGDWLAVRYNDTENNLGFWEFHNGIRRLMKFSDRNNKFMLDRSQYPRAEARRRRRRREGLDRRTGSASSTRSAPPRARAATARRPNPDLFPENNPSRAAGQRPRRPVGQDRFAPAISKTTSSVPK
jgi:hypothetical protein